MSTLDRFKEILEETDGDTTAAAILVLAERIGSDHKVWLAYSHDDGPIHIAVEGELDTNTLADREAVKSKDMQAKIGIAAIKKGSKKK